ncbi:MAG TPA: ABC transporter ATP-binding protein [Christensenellaceae bacterium]|nr:ABC transporter ATP-binding protein [Christensenellaceae bacterium]
METAISTENLTKRYGRARGIENVSLEVLPGQIFGFIGPNGAGKSTFIRTLLGLIRPSSGHVSVLGNTIPLKSRSVLKQIGYMPSEASYYRGMRALDVFRMSSRLRRKDCERESWVLSDRLGLDPTRPVADLSFGNQKKVAIVAAMQHKPKLLILDEPTSGLDPLVQRAFWDILHERNRQGTTIFISSHVLSEVQQHCSHAAIIRDGRILVSDSVSRLGENTARRITLRGINELTQDIINFSGVLKVDIHSSESSILYQGDMHDLLARINQLPYSDIIITEPSLEEIFLHVYERGQ